MQEISEKWVRKQVGSICLICLFKLHTFYKLQWGEQLCIKLAYIAFYYWKKNSYLIAVNSVLCYILLFAALTCLTDVFRTLCSCSGQVCKLQRWQVGRVLKPATVPVNTQVTRVGLLAPNAPSVLLYAQRCWWSVDYTGSVMHTELLISDEQVRPVGRAATRWLTRVGNDSRPRQFITVAQRSSWGWVSAAWMWRFTPTTSLYCLCHSTPTSVQMTRDLFVILLLGISGQRHPNMLWDENV